VGRFRAFVAAGMGTSANPPLARAGAHPNSVGTGWDSSWDTSLAANQAALIAALKCDPELQTWTDDPGGNEVRPINCVSWFEAMAFCAWDGGFLPTEAEWNFGAAGGDQQRAFPWSSPAPSLLLDPEHASFISNGSNCMGDGLPECTVNDLVPVGSKPLGDGRWGQADLAGNVSEWVLDWAGGFPSSCIDCVNLVPAVGRVHRGGSFVLGATFLRTGVRVNRMPAGRVPQTGFRCARPPTPAP
jgi:formylglycine-generating enzyme